MYRKKYRENEVNDVFYVLVRDREVERVKIYITK